MALDHAGTPAQLPAVGVAVCDVEVAVLDFEDEGELVECEVLVVVFVVVGGGGGGGADAPPVSAFFAATSYRPFAIPPNEVKDQGGVGGPMSATSTSIGISQKKIKERKHIISHPKSNSRGANNRERKKKKSTHHTPDSHPTSSRRRSSRTAPSSAR